MPLPKFEIFLYDKNDGAVESNDFAKVEHRITLAAIVRKVIYSTG